MKIFRSLGLQWHEWVVITLILAVAAGFALTVNSYSKRFEEALEVEADAKQHQITELVSTLAALERTIRTGEGRAGQLRLANITSSLDETSELLEARLRNHQFSANGTYSRALSQLNSLIKNLQNWLTNGFAGLSATDPIVLQMVSQEIYLAKLQLERSAKEASDGTLRLLSQQSEQIRNFSQAVGLLILVMCVMFIWAWLLHTRNRAAQAKLWHQRKLTSDSINNINEGFVLTGAEGQVLVVNKTLPLLSPGLGRQLEKHTYDAALRECLLDESLTVVHNGLANQIAAKEGQNESSDTVAGKNSDKALQAKTSANDSSDTQAQVMEYLTKEGLSLRVTSRATGDGGRVTTYTDITDLKETQKKLHQQANYDYLTDIANRSYYVVRLQEALSAAKRHGHKVALMQFDLDNFKQVNDTLGHDVGDQLLITTAKRIKTNLREFDLAARIGGDEFAAILDHVSDESEVVATAERIMNELREKLEIDGVEIDFSASIGIAVFPDHASDIESLIKHADIACYRAKDSGRNNFKIYGSDMKAQAQQMLTLETKLRSAIELDELSLIYQPQLLLENSSITCVEAFSRWYDPILGNVEPYKFIPIAEKNGLISKLGEQVLQKAFKQLSDWRDAGIDDMNIAVNVTKRNLYMATLPEIIDQLCTRYEMSASNLSFEITEDAISHDPAEAAKVLETLAALGLRIVIDDYGIGTSSLPRIRQLPIDALKIDGVFTEKITDDESARDIVAAIISSASSLRIETIAEKVESRQQAELLKEMGCTAVQGYYVGSPQLADELFDKLKESSDDTKAGNDPDKLTQFKRAS